MSEFIRAQSDVDLFDEAEYLLANPDVGEAVRRGDISSGLEHYSRWGKYEHRTIVRFDRPLLRGLDVSRLRGAEIGALCRPIVKKEDGEIFYVDYADQQFLKQRYQNDPAVDVDAIVAVDAVWGERSLSEALNETSTLDYVLASHVIEHVPDLVTWLQEINEILKPDGTLRLAIPDKRYCFDFLRVETGLPDILDAYIRKARAPTPRAILDFCLNMRDVDTEALWEGSVQIESLRAPYTPEDAMGIARDALTGNYHDVHCWAFTPSSFRNLMSELCRLGLITLGCDFVISTQRGSLEFFVSLSKKADAKAAYESWIDKSAA
jgi:SAM-dependent methyltransferase